jgi:hypothetical protein
MANKKHVVNWPLPKELHEELIIIAEAEKRSVTQMAIILIEKGKELYYNETELE